MCPYKKNKINSLFEGRCAHNFLVYFPRPNYKIITKTINNKDCKEH